MLSQTAFGQYTGWGYKVHTFPLFAASKQSETYVYYGNGLADHEQKISTGSVNAGYQGGRIAALIPAGEPGWPGNGYLANVLERYEKGLPQSAMILATGPVQTNCGLPQAPPSLYACGYSSVGPRGKLFNAPHMDSAPIWRLMKTGSGLGCMINGCDEQSEVTMDPQRVNQLVSQGFVNTGTIGYGFLPTGSSNELAIWKHGNRVYVRLPARLNGSYLNPSDYLCEGYAEIWVNGVFQGSWINRTIGPEPGSASMWSCYIDTGITVGFAPTHVRAFFGGAAGRRRNGNATYGATEILYPQEWSVILR